jgi:hypothetical protein
MGKLQLHIKDCMEVGYTPQSFNFWTSTLKLTTLKLKKVVGNKPSPIFSYHGDPLSLQETLAHHKLLIIYITLGKPFDHLWQVGNL